jgi:hypothetical protein
VECPKIAHNEKKKKKKKERKGYRGDIHVERVVWGDLMVGRDKVMTGVDGPNKEVGGRPITMALERNVAVKSVVT